MSARVTAPISSDDERLFAFRRNVVVAASAGTGKTHRLTALYVLVALGLTSRGRTDPGDLAEPVRPSRIVATTFSRAAAQEMRTRVEQALAELARWDADSARPFEEIIAAREARAGERLAASVVRARASAALLELPAARIDTLHGFAGRIVRAHSLVVGAPPDAHVLEEDEARRLGDRAVDEALSDALERGGAEAAAARTLTAASSGVAFARRDVMRLLDRLDEEGLDTAELSFTDHGAEAVSLAAELLATAHALMDGAADPFKRVAEPLARALEAGDWTSGLGSWTPELDALVATLWTLRLPPDDKRTPGERALAEIRARVTGKNNLERAQRLAAFLREAPMLVERERGVLDLCADAQRRYAAAKRHAGALGFGDVLRFARRGLLDGGAASAQVRESLDVLLVDEFQDTSRVQRDIVYLARERSDSGRREGEIARPHHLEEHGLFVVGDRKQSIYGFRGVDVSIFSEVCAELAGAPACEALRLSLTSAAERPVADFVALRETRRSGPAITDFVNAFSALDFRGGRAPNEAPRSFEVEYGPAEHLVAAGEEGDEVVFIRDDGGVPSDADPLVVEATGPAREAFVAAAFVASEVRARRDAGEVVQWSDIAILARRRSTIPLVELALGRLGVPYVVAGRALYQASEVRDVAALLRLVLDPRDRSALAAVLRGPAACLSDSALAILAIPGRGLSLSLDARARRPRSDRDRELLAREDLLEPTDRAHLDRFRQRFVETRAALLRSTPAEALDRAIRWFEIDRVIAALPRASARLGNLERLIAIARRQARHFAGFSRWLDRQIADDVDEAEAVVFSGDDDAVRLTTIHGAKGLDFPRVVLVDLGASPAMPRSTLSLSPDREAGASPALIVRHVDARGVSIPTTAYRAAFATSMLRERAERRRLTYVAITRARRSLVLIGAPESGRRDSAFSTLVAGLEGDLSGKISRTLDAGEVLLRSERPAEPPSSPPAVTGIELRPPRPATQVVSLATTPLGIYAGCRRRFELRYLLGLEEPVASGQLELFESPLAAEPSATDDSEIDPREVGRAAHRVLERFPAEEWGVMPSPVEMALLLEAEGLPPGAHRDELARGIAAFLGGEYARDLRRRGATLHREEAFVSPIEHAEFPTLHLRGAIDLVAVHEDGSADVIDYKDSKPRSSLDRYEFQLRAYALVARRHHGSTRVRAGILFLGAPEPRFLTGDGPGGALSESDHTRFEAELARLAGQYATDRHDASFPGALLPVCRSLACGFVTACHGKSAG